MSELKSDRFNTATGRTVHALTPDIEAIDIEDIALSLARQCRFMGHMRRDVWFYSVAQHSVHVSYECAPEHALLGLLHDAAEAYVQDLISPIKHSIGYEYACAERRWAVTIGRRYGLGERLALLPVDVLAADKVLFSTEVRDLCQPRNREGLARALPWTIEPWTAQAAYDAFTVRFRQLYTAARAMPDYSAVGERP